MRGSRRIRPGTEHTTHQTAPCGRVFSHSRGGNPLWSTTRRTAAAEGESGLGIYRAEPARLTVAESTNGSAECGSPAFRKDKGSPSHPHPLVPPKTKPPARKSSRPCAGHRLCPTLRRECREADPARSPRQSRNAPHRLAGRSRLLRPARCGGTGSLRLGGSSLARSAPSRVRVADSRWRAVGGRLSAKPSRWRRRSSPRDVTCPGQAEASPAPAVARRCRDRLSEGQSNAGWLSPLCGETIRRSSRSPVPYLPSTACKQRRRTTCVYASQSKIVVVRQEASIHNFVLEATR